jgi:hypothetical protein
VLGIRLGTEGPRSGGPPIEEPGPLGPGARPRAYNDVSPAIGGRTELDEIRRFRARVSAAVQAAT